VLAAHVRGEILCQVGFTRSVSLRPIARAGVACVWRRTDSLKILSVFFCRLQVVDLVRLKSRLYDVIHLDQDQVLFISLRARCASAIKALGRPIEAHDARDTVIVS
jgi:hypothetical protein